jgi:hypothetical protein
MKIFNKFNYFYTLFLINFISFYNFIKNIFIAHAFTILVFYIIKILFSFNIITIADCSNCTPSIKISLAASATPIFSMFGTDVLNNISSSNRMNNINLLLNNTSTSTFENTPLNFINEKGVVINPQLNQSTNFYRFLDGFSTKDTFLNVKL